MFPRDSAINGSNVRICPFRIGQNISHDITICREFSLIWRYVICKQTTSLTNNCTKRFEFQIYTFQNKLASSQTCVAYLFLINRAQQILSGCVTSTVHPLTIFNVSYKPLFKQYHYCRQYIISFRYKISFARNYCFVLMPIKVRAEITYLFPNFNGCTVELWKWISNFISYFIMDVITSPYWD